LDHPQPGRAARRARHLEYREHVLTVDNVAWYSVPAARTAISGTDTPLRADVVIA